MAKQNSAAVEEGAGGTRRAIAFVVTSPSGGGKTTICRRLLERDDQLRFSISCTSRPPRTAERDGIDYFFVSEEEFKERIERGRFLEWALVHGHRYGTDRALTEELLEGGHDVLMDIDIQGADNVREAIPDCVRVFILPPSREVMTRRLRERGTNGEEELERRIGIAAEEMSMALNFDFAVVNDDLDTAVGEVEAIITAERLKLKRHPARVDKILRSFDLPI